MVPSYQVTKLCLLSKFSWLKQKWDCKEPSNCICFLLSLVSFDCYAYTAHVLEYLSKSEWNYTLDHINILDANVSNTWKSVSLNKCTVTTIERLTHFSAETSNNDFKSTLGISELCDLVVE